MKSVLGLGLGLGLLAAPLIAVPLAAATLVTPLPGGNGQDGIMFDIVAGPAPLTLTSLEFLARNTGTLDLEVRYKVGGIGANPLDPTGWVLLDSFAGVSLVDFELTALDITDLGLGAGATLGLYITGTGAFSATEYSNGINVGDVWASNSDLAILTGFGIEYLFNDSFPARNFNGSITYAAIPEAGTWTMLLAGFGLVGGAIRRRQTAAA